MFSQLISHFKLKLLKRERAYGDSSLSHILVGSCTAEGLLVIQRRKPPGTTYPCLKKKAAR